MNTATRKTEPQMTLDDLRKSTRATVTREEAAVLFDVDPRTITTGIKEGNIPAIKLGRRVVIPREKFLALFD